jgi:type IV secretory pathway TraG/TraD family ATPase VirD4
LNKAIQDFAFSVTVLIITSGACLFVSWLMDYPPLFYIVAIGFFIVVWYFATVDLIRKQRSDFESTRLGLIWSMLLIFIVFLSAGGAYTLIDTDWFLDNTGIQGDVPYYVGCIAAAAMTGNSVVNQSNDIARSNLLIAEKFVRNLARILTVVIIPWIVLGISLLITAYRQWHSLGAWALSIALTLVAYAAVTYALFSKREGGGRGVFAGTVEEANKILSRLRKPGDEGINWGGTLLPWIAANKHFLVVGTTGSGKTVTIKLLINSIIHYIGIKGSDHRAAFFDAKHELYPYLVKIGVDPKLINILNPFDKRSVRWDIAGDIRTFTQAQQLVAELIPMPEEKGQNSHFPETAREIVANVIESFNILSDKQEAKTGKRIDWRLRDIVIAARYEKFLSFLLKKSRETSHVVDAHFESREFKAVLSTLGTALTAFRGVAALWEHTSKSVSLKDWAENPTGSIILLGWNKEESAALDPINRVMFRRLSDVVIGQDNAEERRTWFFLDELRLVSKGLPGLSELLNIGREKGACCVLGVIDYEGLKHSIGEKIANEVTGLCNNVAGLRSPSDKTATWLAGIFGNAEKIEINLSINAKGEEGTSEHIADRKTFIKGQFQEISEPSELNGFTIGGFYANPYTRPYFFNHIGNSWQNAVPRLTKDELKTGYLPRSSAEQKLKPWDEADLKRLGIPDFDLTEIYGEEEPQPDEENDLNINLIMASDEPTIEPTL